MKVEELNAPSLAESPEIVADSIREAHRDELANLTQQIVARDETIETLTCRLLSLEIQNATLRTQLTVASGELIKIERAQQPKA